MARARVDAALQPFLPVTAIESDYSGKPTGSAPFTKPVARFGAQAPPKAKAAGCLKQPIRSRWLDRSSSDQRRWLTTARRTGGLYNGAVRKKKLGTEMRMNAWCTP